ncbi:MAG: hypothetical protein JXA46_07450 [Dehalococcoidales bacterium]|nr:hypothetical protein [Dehalococcoidales bacterium]
MYYFSSSDFHCQEHFVALFLWLLDFCQIFNEEKATFANLAYALSSRKNSANISCGYSAHSVDLTSSIAGKVRAPAKSLTIDLKKLGYGGSAERTGNTQENSALVQLLPQKPENKRSNFPETTRYTETAAQPQPMDTWQLPGTSVSG